MLGGEDGDPAGLGSSPLLGVGHFLYREEGEVGPQAHVRKVLGYEGSSAVVDVSQMFENSHPERSTRLTYVVT